MGGANRARMGQNLGEGEMIIGLSSVARGGKDTFAGLLALHIVSKGHQVSTWAFADELKRELEPIVWAKYGINVWTQKNEEKAIIRDDLVALGRKRREESNGRYWINQIEPAVKAGLDAGVYQIIKDVRYATHAADEAGWIQSLGGKVIHIQRVKADGQIVDYANDEERANDPKVRAIADVTLTIPTFGQDYLDKLKPYVQDAWNQITANRQY